MNFLIRSETPPVIPHLSLSVFSCRQGLADYLEGYHNQVNICLQNEVHVLPVQVCKVSSKHENHLHDFQKTVQCTRLPELFARPCSVMQLWILKWNL